MRRRRQARIHVLMTWLRMGQIYKSPEINSLKHPVLVLFFPFSFDPVFLLAFSPPVSFSLDFLSSGVPPRESDSELDSLIFNPFCGTISDWIAIQMVIFRHTARELKGGKAMRTHGLGEVEHCLRSPSYDRLYKIWK